MGTYNVSYNSFFWREDTVIDTERVEDWWYEVFARGNCHALALAAHERFEGSTLLVDCEDPDAWYEGMTQEANPQHVLVRLTDGTLLDIAYLLPDHEQADRSVPSFWWNPTGGPDGLIEATAYEVHALVEVGYMEPNVEMARECLDTLLAR